MLGISAGYNVLDDEVVCDFDGIYFIHHNTRC